MQQVDQWIDAVVKNRTFADVGGLWGTEHEKVTVAFKSGAQKVHMIDITPLGSELWRRFDERCATRGVPVYECIEADINDRSRIAELGSFEVLHCSGVLYHSPEPLHMIVSLSQLCSRVLLLRSAVIPTRISNVCGTLLMEPGSALFVPAMKADHKAIVGQYFKEVGAQDLIGITTAANYSVFCDYRPWWWLFTREYVEALLKVAGFKILEASSDWEDRTALYLAEKAAT